MVRRFTDDLAPAAWARAEFRGYSRAPSASKALAGIVSYHDAGTSVHFFAVIGFAERCLIGRPAAPASEQNRPKGVHEGGVEQVAAWYGWRFAGAEWYFQAGRDPRWDAYPLGVVTLVHTVREACRDGKSAYPPHRLVSVCCVWPAISP
jgi:hypothetical protein